jgi:hypothetical protein
MDEIIGFDHVTQMCVALPPDPLFEMIRGMKQTGCTFPNHELDNAGRRQLASSPNITEEDRRQLQGLNFNHDAESDLCAFTDFDDRAAAVNAACCNQDLATSATQGCTQGRNFVSEHCRPSIFSQFLKRNSENGRRSCWCPHRMLSHLRTHICSVYGGVRYNHYTGAGR